MVTIILTWLHRDAIDSMGALFAAVIGYGLYRRRNAARILAIGYSLGILLFTIPIVIKLALGFRLSLDMLLVLASAPAALGSLIVFSTASARWNFDDGNSSLA